jgi:hypothetical protein
MEQTPVTEGLEGSMQPKQDRFEFDDSPKGHQTEPPHKPVKVPRESTSLCAYCGARMPSALLDSTPPADDTRWTAAAPYHTPTCRWIVTRGLRLEKGAQ